MGGSSSLLGRALEGGNRGTSGGVLSAHGWRGTADRHQESGKTVEEQAGSLVGRDLPIRDDDVGLMDKNDDILRKQLRGYKSSKVASLLKLGFDMNKLSEPDGHSFLYTLQNLMAGRDDWIGEGRQFLDDFYSAAQKNDKYQEDSEVPRAGILKDPEGFTGGGWSEAGPTDVQSAASLHDNGPGPGADDMANYRDEQAMKNVTREMKVKKKTAALLKLAMQPPMDSLRIETAVPQDEDPDLRRLTATPRATAYQPETRTTNRKVVSGVKTSAAITGMPANNVVQDFTKRMKDSMKSSVSKKVTPKKTAPLAEVRDETTSSPNKVPKGHAELDSKVPNAPGGSDAKVAHVLRLCFS